jgi:signal transduction histidine kinase
MIRRYAGQFLGPAGIMFTTDIEPFIARAKGAFLCLLVTVAVGWGSVALQGGEAFSPGVVFHHCLPHTAQLRELPSAEYLSGCDIHLRGVVSLVDASRQMVIIQEGSNAVAIHCPKSVVFPKMGQWVEVDGVDCSPYYPRFPDFPCQPSGSELLPSFESPTNWGEYYLSRTRGWLIPPTDGKYTFWIASDNSSELWLSVDSNPAKMRRIASVSRFVWVEPREWSRTASQQSEAVLLKGGEIYYIEALQEQSGGSDNLSVAWEGPTINQSVIEGKFLAPWRYAAPFETNTGILREYWTNFSQGTLAGVSGPRPFSSALSVRNARFSVLGTAVPPPPLSVSLSQSWQAADNYRWVRVEAAVKFIGVDGAIACIEMSDGQNSGQARLLDWSPELLRRMSNALIRVEGVCEGVNDQKGALIPGLLWVPSSNNLVIVDASPTNSVLWSLPQTVQTDLDRDSAIEGFFSTRGVVTFNDWVFGTNYIFLQEGNAALRVTLSDGRFKNQFKQGYSVEVGGGLERGKNIALISPVSVSEGNRHVMPLPVDQPLSPPVSGSREGRWTEVQGVIHTANPNGTLTLFDNNGSVCLWIGKTTSNQLARLVDAKVRVRGVLTLELLNTPVLLVPSSGFLDVEDASLADPFQSALHPISDALAVEIDLARTHRAHVRGEVTWRDGESFYIQDASGGVLARTPSAAATPSIGKQVELLAFPTITGSFRTLTEAVTRPIELKDRVHPVELDLTKGMSPNQYGVLVSVNATLLSRKSSGPLQTLELQQEERAFVATLASDNGRLPSFRAGSLLRLTGVCSFDASGSTINILLRTPSDITVLSPPPWWTWRKTAVLIGALLVVVFGALLWVLLLRGRLERQQADQLAFSRQVLERVEEERRRIASNLHDSLGQVLLAIKNHAVLAMQSNPPEPGLQDRLKDISVITSQAIDEVRHITHGLRPYQLDRLGLTQAVRATVNRAENGAISFATRVEDIDGLFDKDSEIHVYRVVQEAVNNIVKHSGATEAAVVIKKRDRSITLSVRDNGKGFDQTKAPSELHDVGYGLSGMAERVRILKGFLTVDSHPGQGTSLNIEIPLKIK